MNQTFEPELHAAPVQGHTDAAYRHFFNQVYGTPICHYTPFIRLEKGSVRPHDLKDLTSELNRDLDLVPQIIFRDAAELNTLVTAIARTGARRIDLNMGCPFPLQTGHGRGAATISNTQLLHDIAQTVDSNPEIQFSVKMRLGLEMPDEWKTALPVLNTLPLRHITMHPRVAKQQYRGDLDLVQFEDFVQQCSVPVVYNGMIASPGDALQVARRWPGLKGIMIGRGLLGDPSLASRIASPVELPVEQRLAKILRFHFLLLDHYSNTLCGDSQILSKIKPFWEYAEPLIGRKAWKNIRKAANMAKYHSAVASI